MGLDVYNGSASQVQTFKNQTTITYPLCLNAGSVTSAYNVTRDYSAVVDQDGILRYKGPRVDTGEIVPLIDNLLTTTGIDPDGQVAENYELAQNYPNPFNPTTRIAFSIPKSQQVTIQIYDTQGKFVRTLLNNKMNAGEHEISWNGLNQNGSTAASGIFYYTMQTDNFAETKKMILIR